MAGRPALRVSGAAHLAGIIGWPVDHSLSPAIHNEAFEARGLDWTYVTLAVRAGAIEEGIGLLHTLGVEGANVTIPHKEAIIPLLDELEGDAEAFGAVNTVTRDGDRLIGSNTDGAGFIRFLRLDAAFEPASTHALVLGAGGAARAVAVSLAREGAAVTVTARRRDQAKAIAKLADGIEIAKWGEPVPTDLVVNATPAREGLPLGAVLDGAKVAVDLIYHLPPTELLEAAHARGARAYDGLGMLVHQAGLSFERWTGVAAPLDVMRAAAERARGGETVL